MSTKDLISDVIAAPLGDVVAQLGLGVAQAQYAIDANTIANLKALYSSSDDAAKELSALGYRPTWYVIPEAKAEVNLALSITQSRSQEGKTQTELSGTTIDASYKNQFDFNIEASSKLSLTFVPIPAPERLDELNVVPQVTGMTLGAAQVLLERMNIEFSVTPKNAANNRTITRTEPAAGSLLEAQEPLQLII